MKEEDKTSVTVSSSPLQEDNFSYLKGSKEEPTPRYFGGQPAQTKKLSKFAQQIIWECAKDERYKNVIQVWCEVDTYCKPKKYTPEQVGSFLRYCKKKLTHEHLKEKLNSATVKEPTTNLLYVPTYLPLKRTNLTKNASTTTNGQELVSRSLSGGVFYVALL